MSIFGFLNDLGNYDERRIGRIEAKENGGIGVSTAYTSDEGYETALLDANGVHPVERYQDVEVAKRGHCKWIKAAPLLRRVVMLGWVGLIEDEEIDLVEIMEEC